MTSISHEAFEKSCGKALILLLAISVYSIYLLYKGGFNVINIVILIISLICIVGVRRISIVGEKAISDKNYEITTKDSIILSQVIILMLGIFSMYIFAFKGIYGLYLAIVDFSMFSVIFRLAIIIASFQLISATSKIQTVFKAIQSNKITRN